MPQEGRIALVVGSTRPNRICGEIAAWVQRTISEQSELSYEILDLAEIGLPFLDEPLKAALEQYEHEHTKRWSQTVRGYDGFLFVFPQYNWGYPAVLKNALDYLYHEWHDKPATLLTYGTRGGNRAAAQLIEVLNGLRMRILASHVEAIVTDADVDEQWQLKDVSSTLRPTIATLRTMNSEMSEALTNNQ